MIEDRPPRGFRKAFRTASRIAKDSKRTADLLSAAVHKAKAHQGRLQKVREDLECLFRMVGAWVKGDFKRVPLQAIVVAISALVYFINPFDLVHDYLPALGYLDDVTIIAFVVSSLRKELDEFRIWEKHSK